MLKTVDLWIRNARHKPRPFSYFYPLEWHRMKPAFESSALNPVKYWLIIIPFIAGLVSVFPIDINFPGANIEIGGEFQPPFNIFLSYVAAILYMISFAIFRIFCPQYVQQQKPVFSALPDGVTRTEIVDRARQAILADFSRQIKLDNGSVYLRQPGDFYKKSSVENDELFQQDVFEIREVMTKWNELSSYTAKNILLECGRRITPRETDRNQKFIFREKSEFNEEIHFLDSENIDKNLFNMIFVPDLRILENREDRELIARMTHTALYINLSESRTVTRLIAYLLLVASSFLGLYLILQIVLRGFELFYSSGTPI